MNKQAPSAGRMATMVVFALSCVGLLIFLWTSFGGSIPLAAKGYRFTVEFNQAVQLADEADVRIAGVSVGKVVAKSIDSRTGLTRAVLEIDSRFAPRPADTRAILREKTLLGETYIQLSPGNPTAPKLPDNGVLPEGQVAPTVQLDQILNAFDPGTRQAFRVWMQQGGMALTRRGQDFNTALAELYPFATNVDSVLAVLRRDDAAASLLLRDTGQVFSALSSSPSRLQALIRNSNGLFAATAARNSELAAAIRAFPAFLVATRLTIARVDRFAGEAKPLIDELRPAAVQLSPALEAGAVVAPELRDLLVDIGPLNAASVAGIPALDHFLNGSVPWLRRLRPYFGGLVPVLDYINVFRREIAAFFANGAAVSESTDSNIAQTAMLHYLRISNPVNPEVLTAYQHRLESNRPNPYMLPGGYSALASGLQVFGDYLCTHNAIPTIGSSIPASLVAVLKRAYYTARPGGPACKGQSRLGTATTGHLQAFPHLQPLP